MNSKHLSLVNKIGDKTEFTIIRVHCIIFQSVKKKYFEKLVFITYVAFNDILNFSQYARAIIEIKKYNDIIYFDD